MSKYNVCQLVKDYSLTSPPSPFYSAEEGGKEEGSYMEGLMKMAVIASVHITLVRA